MNIGFDFDKVFINYPPLIPDGLVDFIYKGRIFKKNKREDGLSYRFPSLIEKKIRLFSHQLYFRHPIKSNIKALEKISREKGINTYLVSSRYSFLKDITSKILEKNKLKQYFKGIYFNYENSQPHLFKEETIKKLGIEKYIDDDLDLALYLSEKMPKLKIYWLNYKRQAKTRLPKNVIPIKNINEFLEKYI